LERPADVFRVLTLNSWFHPPFDGRATEISAWIDLLDPDVVCLQEVRVSAPARAELIEYVARNCRERWYSSIGHRSEWSNLAASNTILSRRPIEEATTHSLPESVGRSRNVLHAVTSRVDVFCTHLTSSPAGALVREAEVLAIDEIIESSAYRDSPLPPILAGDFNATPGSSAIRYLRGEQSLERRATFFQDAWGVRGEGDGHTWSHRNPHVPPTYLFDARVDYVFVGMPKAPLSWSGGSDPNVTPVGQVVDARVVCDRSLTGTFASDHFGVVADIRC